MRSGPHCPPAAASRPGGFVFPSRAAFRAGFYAPREVGSPAVGLSRPVSKDFRVQREVLREVVVRDNNVDQALKALKKKMQREGIFREMKLPQPLREALRAARRARRRRPSRRARKLARKQRAARGAAARPRSALRRGAAAGISPRRNAVFRAKIARSSLADGVLVGRATDAAEKCVPRCCRSAVLFPPPSLRWRSRCWPRCLCGTGRQWR